MARELLAQEVKRNAEQSLTDVHGHVANAVIHELLQRWKAGMRVTEDAHIETVKLAMSKDPKTPIGFRMYLVSWEPPVLGPLRTEILEETAS